MVGAEDTHLTFRKGVHALDLVTLSMEAFEPLDEEVLRVPIVTLTAEDRRLYALTATSAWTSFNLNDRGKQISFIVVGWVTCFEGLSYLANPKDVVASNGIDCLS